MGKLADKLRGKSKLDNVIIAGSEIREALDELELSVAFYQGNYEQSAKDIAELEAIVKSYQTDGQKILADQRAENERLREALHFYAYDNKRPNDGPWGADSTDFGAVARKALDGELRDKAAKALEDK